MIDASLSGRTALVTGGSRGIGRGIAVRFAKAGAKVVIGYREQQAAADETLRLIRDVGGEGHAVAADVTTAEGCAALHEGATKAVGKIDILVNNAGFHRNDVFMLLKDESFAQLFDVHVMGVVRMTRLVATGMIARKFGRVINISSVAASKPTVGQVNYAAMKGAVESMTRALAIELGKRGVNVNCLSLGLIETDMAKDSDSAYVLAHQLVKRLGHTDEVAAWALMLASQYGDYVTGRVLELDGGFMLI
jgi:3-oxoacyl-[acyl-carrier protein] reductase